MIDNFVWWPFALVAGALGVVIGILLFAFWIWMIVDCAQRKFKNEYEKIGWIIGLVLIGWVGAIVYLFVVKVYNPRGLLRK